MGNRAMLISKDSNAGIYLHWNGGLDSVGAFLKYCELRNFRGFDDDYGKARFCQVVGNFFGGTLSIGIEYFRSISDLKDWDLDNGVYVISGWEIEERLYTRDNRLEWDYDDGFIRYIDKCQPESEQLGDYLDAEEADPMNLKIGDVIFIRNIDDLYNKTTIIGITEDGIPYHDAYSNGVDNPNNLVTRRCMRYREE